MSAVPHTAMHALHQSVALGLLARNTHSTGIYHVEKQFIVIIETTADTQPLIGCSSSQLPID